MITRCQQPTSNNTLNRSLSFAVVAALIVLMVTLSTLYNNHIALAEDSAAAPAFDISSLASLASNLDSNPQIMSMVSSLLSQQKPAVGAASAGSAVASGSDGEPTGEFGSLSDLDPNSIVQPPPGEMLSSGGELPLKRGAKTASVSTTATTTSETQTTQKSNTASASGSPLSGLMSLLPNVLPNLNLNSLSSLLGGIGGGGQKKSAESSASQSSAISQSRSADLDESAAVAPTTTTTSTATGLTQTGTQSSSSAATGAAGGGQQAMMAPLAVSGNTAQSVINQVLSAYVSGQIPNELIQLGLSGRVPPQIVELALSGQVPPQIIQMIITGQIPMSTINAFLATMQTNGPPRASTSSPSPSNTQSSQSSSSPLSTTGKIFEALFNFRQLGGGGGSQKESGGPSITLPTLLGPVPIQMPTFPNVRRFGQMVGGTITNMASMIPF